MQQASEGAQKGKRIRWKWGALDLDAQSCRDTVWPGLLQSQDGAGSLPCLTAAAGQTHGLVSVQLQRARRAEQGARRSMRDEESQKGALTAEGYTGPDLQEAAQSCYRCMEDPCMTKCGVEHLDGGTRAQLCMACRVPHSGSGGQLPCGLYSTP